MPKKPAGTHISHCQFVGVQYDARAVQAIETIATGLVENAKALGALANVLKASNVTIEAMLRMDSQIDRVGVSGKPSNLRNA